MYALESRLNARQHKHVRSPRRPDASSKSPRKHDCTKYVAKNSSGQQIGDEKKYWKSASRLPDLTRVEINIDAKFTWPSSTATVQFAVPVRDNATRQWDFLKTIKKENGYRSRLLMNLPVLHYLKE